MSPWYRRAAVLRISWPVVSGAALIVAAAFTPTGWRPAIWSLALVIKGPRNRAHRVRPRPYTYAHLPMVVGIILFAFGVRTTLGHVGAELRLIPALALCCGPALYLLGFVALRWRATRTLGRGRPSAAVGFALLTAAATHVPALAALALVTVAWGALHAYELIGWREERARRRTELAPEPGLVETHT